MFPLLRDTSMPAVWDAPIVEGNQAPSNSVKMKALEELKHNVSFVFILYVGNAWCVFFSFL